MEIFISEWISQARSGSNHEVTLRLSVHDPIKVIPQPATLNPGLIYYLAEQIVPVLPKYEIETLIAACVARRLEA